MSLRINIDKFMEEYKAAFSPKTAINLPTEEGLKLLLSFVQKDIDRGGLEYFSGYEGLSYLFGTWKLEARKLKTITLAGGKTAKVWVEFTPVRETRANPNGDARQKALYKSQARYWGKEGRGYTQITWDYNYIKLGDSNGIKGMPVTYNGQEYYITGAVLNATPDLALVPELAYRIATIGAIRGLFRPPHNLAEYFPKGKAPRYKDARNIINANGDQQDAIAANAAAFERIFRASIEIKPDLQALAISSTPAHVNSIQPNSQEIAKAIDAGQFKNPPAPDKSEDTGDYSQAARQQDEGGELPKASASAMPGDYYRSQVLKELQAQALEAILQPKTKLKAWVVAIIGFILTNIAALLAWYKQLSPVYQGALLIAGAIATSALMFGIIYLKNHREERAFKAVSPGSGSSV